MRAGASFATLLQFVRRAGAGFLPLALVAGLLLGSGGPALAANPTFAIVGPAEWNLPVTPSANVFIQTGVIQSNSKAYAADGSSNDIHGGGHTYVGITRFAHLFSFKSMPKVGFYWEALLPEVRVEAPGVGVSGIGDPLFAAAVYARPTENTPVKTMIGFQNIVSIPVGNSEVTNNYWQEMPTIIGDASYGKLGFDATLGASFSSTYHKSGEADRTIGNMYFAEAAVRYQLLPWLAPFVTYNYQVNESGRVHNATGDVIAGSHENVLGAGVKANFTPDRWLDLWYDNGVAGVNTVKTNAVYLRFVNIF